jgi:hypothetical protein
VVRGRERRAIQVFNESVEYWGGLQGDGKIEDFELAFLSPHGGDLAGYAMLRGSQDQMNALRIDEDFEKLLTRVDLIVENLGIVDALLGDGVARAMGIYMEEIKAI